MGNLNSEHRVYLIFNLKLKSDISVDKAEQWIKERSAKYVFELKEEKEYYQNCQFGKKYKLLGIRNAHTQKIILILSLAISLNCMVIVNMLMMQQLLAVLEISIINPS